MPDLDLVLSREVGSGSGQSQTGSAALPQIFPAYKAIWQEGRESCFRMAYSLSPSMNTVSLSLQRTLYSDCFVQKKTLLVLSNLYKKNFGSHIFVAYGFGFGHRIQIRFSYSVGSGSCFSLKSAPVISDSDQKLQLFPFQ